MFYRTSHFRTRYGNITDITNPEYYVKEPDQQYYYNLKSIDYQFEADKITMTIEFLDKTVVETIYDKDIKQTHDGGVVAVIYDADDLNRGNKIRLRFIERYKLSKDTKADPSNYSQYNSNQFRILQIIVPSAQDSLLNMDYAVNAPSYISITSNMPITNHNSALNLRFRIPKLEFIDEIPFSISKNDEFILKFKVLWHDELYTHPITVYPRARQGYVNKTKVITKEGIGSFKFVPLYLDPGDTAEVEVGFKHRSNVLSTEFTIID